MIVQVRPYADLLIRDDQALLLREEQLLNLSGIGIVILELAAGAGVEFDDLVAALEARFGAPAGQDTAEATRLKLDELVNLGVIELTEQNG